MSLRSDSFDFLAKFLDFVLETVRRVSSLTRKLWRGNEDDNEKLT